MKNGWRFDSPQRPIEPRSLSDKVIVGSLAGLGRLLTLAVKVHFLTVLGHS